MYVLSMIHVAHYVYAYIVCHDLSNCLLNHLICLFIHPIIESFIYLFIYLFICYAHFVYETIIFCETALNSAQYIVSCDFMNCFTAGYARQRCRPKKTKRRSQH